MNREQRRQAESFGARFLVAVEVCSDCGMPMCPECGVETMTCSHCGEPNCPECRAYVDWPVGTTRNDFGVVTV